MRVLFASTRGVGHFTPLVPFIAGCERGGHEVMVAGPPALGEHVERAGYRFWVGDEPPEEELGPVWGRVPTASLEEAKALVIGEIFGRLNVKAMLPALEAACEEWRPDVVVREEAELASAIAAERHGVRHARLSVTLAGLEQEALELAGQGLEELQPGVVERIRTSPYLTLVPEALEDPRRARPPRTHRFRDPAAGAPGEPLPDWWDGDPRPLVYVSFGSVAGTLPTAGALYAAAVEAAAELPARVLLALGQRDADVGALGPMPPNLHVEPWVNPADVLPAADAAVSHGGFGTTLGALAHGLALVVVPLFGDQPDNARTVEAAGAGVVVWPDAQAPPEAMRSSLDPAALHRAIEAALRDPAYARRSGELAADMAGHPPADEMLAATGLTDES